MENNEATPGARSGPVSDFRHPMGPSFGKTLGDMRFMGWVGLIYGIMNCLSIVGVIVGIPMIIAAHRFIEGINRFEYYRQDRSEAALQAGFAELGRSFRVMKILTIIHLSLMVGYIAFLFLLGGLGIMSELVGS